MLNVSLFKEKFIKDGEFDYGNFNNIKDDNLFKTKFAALFLIHL